MVAPAVWALWGFGVLLIKACTAQDEKTMEAPDATDVLRYNPEPPKQPQLIIRDADVYLSDLACIEPLRSLAESSRVPGRLYGRCETPLAQSAGLPYAEAEQSLVTIDTSAAPPTVQFDRLYPSVYSIETDTPHSVSTLLYLTEIGDDLFAAGQIAFSGPSHPDELLLFDVRGEQVVATEFPFAPVTLPEPLLDSRGTAVVKMSPDAISNMAFHAATNLLYVATRNVVCDPHCSTPDATWYHNPGTIVQFALTPEHTLIQSGVLATTNYAPVQVAIAGTARNRLIVRNQGLFTVPPSVDVFDTTDGVLLKTLRLEDFGQPPDVVIDAIVSLAVHPNGSEVHVITAGYPSNNPLASVSYVHILDADALTLTSVPTAAFATLSMEVPDAVLLDGVGQLYGVDAIYGYTSVLRYERAATNLQFLGVIVQNPRCFQYAPTPEGYDVSLGGDGCHSFDVGASLIASNYLWRSVENRIVRTPLEDFQ